jgi:hypothetical protein
MIDRLCLEVNPDEQEMLNYKEIPGESSKMEWRIESPKHKLFERNINITNIKRTSSTASLSDPASSNTLNRESVPLCADSCSAVRFLQNEHRQKSDEHHDQKKQTPSFALTSAPFARRYGTQNSLPKPAAMCRNVVRRPVQVAIVCRKYKNYSSILVSIGTTDGISSLRLSRSSSSINPTARMTGSSIYILYHMS